MPPRIQVRGNLKLIREGCLLSFFLYFQGYRASLALDLLVYIFSSCGRVSKPEVQNRFLKQYKVFIEKT